MPGVDIMGDQGFVSDKQKNQAILKELKSGDVISVMVRGRRAEGQIYRELFFVSYRPLGARNDLLFGHFEDAIRVYSGDVTYFKFDDIMFIEKVADGRAAESIRDLLVELNCLRRDVAKRNKFITDHLLIDISERG